MIIIIFFLNMKLWLFLFSGCRFYFSICDIKNKQNWNQSVGIDFDLFIYFLKNFSLVVFIDKNQIE